MPANVSAPARTAGRRTAGSARAHEALAEQICEMIQKNNRFAKCPRFIDEPSIAIPAPKRKIMTDSALYV
jgi:hypothetical protein